MKKLVVAAASAALLSTAASAAVTYDPAVGGFAGKGDLQTLFNWNNNLLQANATGIVFTWESAAEYDAVCEFDTETGGKNSKIIHHSPTRTIAVNVNATVVGDARQRNQITGFNLGAASAAPSADAPVVGGACPGGNLGNGVYTSVVQTGSSAGGLYAEDTLAGGGKKLLLAQ